MHVDKALLILGDVRRNGALWDAMLFGRARGTSCEEGAQDPEPDRPERRLTGQVETTRGLGSDTLLTRILVTLGSAASIGFGIWHFFVPRMWNWYSYIDASAIELVVAVRAINVFFSLSLVLFGVMNLALTYGHDVGRYSVLVVLGATCVLWAARVGMQLVSPQGSMSPALQYGMLGAFVVVLGCYAAAFAMALLDKGPG